MSQEAQELFLDYQKKDRKFRFFQSLFTLAILALLLVVVIAQFQTLGTVNKQLDEQRLINAETTRQSEIQRDQILRRLDCIVVFFSQKNREDLSIDNVESCSLNASADPEQFFITEPPRATAQSTTPNSANTAPSTPPVTTSEPPETQRRAVGKIEEVVEDALRSASNRINTLIGGK